ncbi:hypothetical protein BDQ17DRAFT_1324090 [Cyathus striatus]|nr:hypothetical protein BDQ17DRAFT_1324090 [Cyathus striatus]
MDDLDDNNGLDKTFLEHIQKSLLVLVNVLTTEDTIDDNRRVEIFLAEIFDLIEHRQGYNITYLNIELDRTILLIRNTMERFPYPLDTGYISLGRLATALHTRFTKSKNIDDSDESLYITRHICELDPGLGAILVEKFQSGVGNEDDLLESVSALRRAYELVPESANYRLQCLLNLTVALTLAYEKFSQPEYLEEAIDKNRLIMMMKTEKDISDSGSSILNANMSLYGNKEDLNEAIEIAAAILNSKTIDDGTDRCRALERLAYYLQSRVERDGNLDDANAIVEIHREVLQLRMSESESHRPDSLNNLGSALDERYKITGDKNSLDEAIAIFREAETITPESQDIRSYILHNLSNALRERYYATGRI